jgi:hypothetical protein
LDNSESAVSHPQAENPTQVCERLLRAQKTYYIDHQILRSEVAVIDRLLARRLDMAPVYEDLHRKLHRHPGALDAFLKLILYTAAFWSPEKIAQARAGRSALTEVNLQIARQAEELASLLSQRTALHNISGFTSDTQYHVCDVLQAAAQQNGLFRFHVQDRLEALRDEFDLKYWPTLSEFLLALAADAGAAAETPPKASDPLTAAATSASRSSLADFFKALLVAIDENRAGDHGQLPDDFKASDGTLGTVANCALDLDPDDMVGAPYVKRMRQRLREADQ